MNINNITDRVDRLLPNRQIISTTIDTRVVISEESEDKLHQLTGVRIDKLGITLYFYKRPSNVGKPTVISFYKGQKDSGLLLKLQDTIDLAKPRDLSDLIDESIHRLIKGELIVPDKVEVKMIESEFPSLSLFQK